MTYEEKVKKVIELAGDYNKIVNDFNRERALFESAHSKFKKDVQKPLESLSLGNIKFAIGNGGYLFATRDNWETNVCVYKFTFFCNEYLLNDTEKLLSSALEEALLKIAANMSTSGLYKIGDVAKFASDASLIPVSEVKDIAEAIKKTVEEYHQVEESFSRKDYQYDNWESDISSKLDLLAREWFQERAVLTPGMKIGIINRKTQETTIRTIKGTTSLGIALKESSSIITDLDRVDTGLTWYLNNGECNDIAKAIRWSPIANFI